MMCVLLIAHAYSRPSAPTAYLLCEWQQTGCSRLISGIR